MTAKIDPTNANTIIEHQLDAHIAALQKELGADVLVYCGPIVYGADDLIRNIVEEIKPKQKKLVVLIETTGGYIEVAQRMADTFRHHYHLLEFIIPNFAMSAGTVLVMAGDAIYMDYYSILGPIDPQVERNGQRIPALGYLEQFKRLIQKSRRARLTTAEMAFLVEKFDPAELYSYEQARDLSISLLKNWLVKYKFKNWDRTKSRNKKVTPKMKERRAVEIAECLNDTKRWNSHGRGISMQVLQIDVNLQIEDFGKNAELFKEIRGYYRLLKDYMLKRSHDGIIHVHRSFQGW